ncbi:hypothetical protein HB662_14500 [Roseomonas frigidaquae]|uniref:Uncharacterized protein n=1 Tax=Falsiroseomonas frigidaquae TaxID=487318 RepID=A0ABX1F0X3_9PROT|nr:hypothetical protein [Falsiroseomonas frigidaquae]NKE45998.1 hypothetical protein [Falsiroseomonas frigidaquae]
MSIGLRTEPAEELTKLMEKIDIGNLVDLQSFFAAMGSCFGKDDKIMLAAEQAAMIRRKAESYLLVLDALDLHVSVRAMRKILTCLDGAVVNSGRLLLFGQNRDDLEGALSSVANIVGNEMRAKLFLALSASKRPILTSPCRFLAYLCSKNFRHSVVKYQRLESASLWSAPRQVPSTR